MPHSSGFAGPSVKKDRRFTRKRARLPLIPKWSPGKNPADDGSHADHRRRERVSEVRENLEGNFSDPLKSEPLLSLRAVSSASEMAAAIRNHERWRRRSWQRHAIFRAKKKPIDSQSHA